MQSDDLAQYRKYLNAAIRIRRAQLAKHLRECSVCLEADMHHSSRCFEATALFEALQSHMVALKKLVGEPPTP